MGNFNFPWMVFKFRVCPAGLFLYLNWECVNPCPIGFYANPGIMICEVCHPTCVACVGNMNSQCT
jgi:hypothetical protein